MHHTRTLLNVFLFLSVVLRDAQNVWICTSQTGITCSQFDWPLRSNKESPLCFLPKLDRPASGVHQADLYSALQQVQGKILTWFSLCFRRQEVLLRTFLCITRHTAPVLSILPSVIVHWLHYTRLPSAFGIPEVWASFVLRCSPTERLSEAVSVEMTAISEIFLSLRPKAIQSSCLIRVCFSGWFLPIAQFFSNCAGAFALKNMWENSMNGRIVPLVGGMRQIADSWFSGVCVSLWSSSIKQSAFQTSQIVNCCCLQERTYTSTKNFYSCLRGQKMKVSHHLWLVAHSLLSTSCANDFCKDTITKSKMQERISFVKCDLKTNTFGQRLLAMRAGCSNKIKHKRDTAQT